MFVMTSNERLAHHLNRAKTRLASSHKTLESSETHLSGTAVRKAMMERLLLKKVNHQLARHLAPNHPEKTRLAHRGQLIGGLGLLIGGLILSLIGALGVLPGFFGQ